MAELRSKTNLIALMWFVVAITQLFAYGGYSLAFGYVSERMVRRIRLACFEAILRQNAAFFDRDEHSTGTLTQMLGKEATAMSGLSGLNLGAILTVIIGVVANVILAYTFQVFRSNAVLLTVGNLHWFRYRCFRFFLFQVF